MKNPLSKGSMYSYARRQAKRETFKGMPAPRLGGFGCFLYMLIMFFLMIIMN